MKLSKCCRAELSYGLGKIGAIIRCSKCNLICDEVDEE